MVRNIMRDDAGSRLCYVTHVNESCHTYEFLARAKAHMEHGWGTYMRHFAHEFLARANLSYACKCDSVCVCVSSVCATPTCGATLRTHQVILIWNESLNITNCRWHVEKLNPQLTKNSREYNELNKHRKITNLINHQNVTHVRGLVEKPNEQPTNTPYMTDSKYHPNITNSNESSKCHEPSRARRKTEWAAGQWFRQKSLTKSRKNHELNKPSQCHEPSKTMQGTEWAACQRIIWTSQTQQITQTSHIQTSHLSVTNLRRLVEKLNTQIANNSGKCHELNKTPQSQNVA